MKAKLLAQRGEFQNAERLAREAVELAERTDYVVVRARALEDIAAVLRLAGPLTDLPTEPHACV